MKQIKLTSNHINLDLKDSKNLKARSVTKELY